MRARYYNPEIKRFINQDVLTGSITDSPTLNRYAYVEGNPISLADPFGLSPAINWRGAGHTILGLLGLLTFVPGCQAIGIVANVINAAWYFAEGEIFNGICSSLVALPGIGGVVGKLGSASRFSNAAMMIQKGTQIASNVGFMGTGFYSIGKMGYENYQKYVERGEDFSFGDFVNDAVNGTFAVLFIYGGAKGLGFDKVNVPTKLKGSVYIGDSNYSTKVPQGFTNDSFNKFSDDLYTFMENNNLPNGKVYIQGSRVSGTATATSDIDIMLRVDKGTFDSWVTQRLNDVPKGTKLFKTIEKAATKGKLSKFDISKNFSKNLYNDFIPQSPIADVDFSIILEGSQYDTGPFRFVFDFGG